MTRTPSPVRPYPVPHRRTQKSGRPQRTVRPWLEHLEDRVMLAVNLSFDPGYRTVEQLHQRLDQINAAFPDLTEVVDYDENTGSFCKIQGGCVLASTDPDITVPGFDLKALRITNESLPGDKPEFFLLANLHAREIVTPELAIRFAEFVPPSVLSSAGLTDVSALGELENLLYLSLANNTIRAADALGVLPKVVVLDISENNLSSVGGLAGARAIDDGDWLGGYDEPGGPWRHNILPVMTAFRGDYRFQSAEDGPHAAEWRFTNLPATEHDLYATWHEHQAQASNAMYTVAAKGGTTDVVVNQKFAPAGSLPGNVTAGGRPWQKLGQFLPDADESIVVTLGDAGDGTVVADGLVLVATALPALDRIDLRGNPLGNDAHEVALPVLRQRLAVPAALRFDANTAPAWTEQIGPLVANRQFTNGVGVVIEDIAQLIDDSDRPTGQFKFEVIADEPDIFGAFFEQPFQALVVGAKAGFQGVTQVTVRAYDGPSDLDDTRGRFGEMTFDLHVDAGAVYGRKFDDRNQDGVQDAGEPGIENWKTFVDVDSDGSHQSAEPFALTDANGDYAIVGAPVNGVGLIDEESQPRALSVPDPDRSVVIESEAEHFTRRADVLFIGPSPFTQSWKVIDATAPAGQLGVGEDAGVPAAAKFAGASGGAYVQLLPDNGTALTDPNTIDSGAKIEYDFYAPMAGTYQLFVRWDGHDGGSNSLYASIVDLKDGLGGDHADWYRYTSTSPDASFATAPALGQGVAAPENTASTGGEVAAVWRLKPGPRYTLRFTPREDGVAVDSWRLVLLPDPYRTAFNRPDGTASLDGFTIDPNPDFPNLWHQSTGRSADTTTHSAPHLVYFGQSEGPTGGGNYTVIGTPVEGTITSPMIDLTEAAAASLQFKYLLDTERVAGQDIASVQLWDGSQWVAVADNQSTTGLAPLSDNAMWSNATIDLAAFIGIETRVRFSFASVTRSNTSGEGWYVDDVVVSATPRVSVGVDFANLVVIDAGSVASPFQSGPRRAAEGDVIHATVMVTDPDPSDGGNFQFQWTVTGPGIMGSAVSPLGSSPDFPFALPDNGTYTLSVQADDLDAGASYADSFQVFADNVAPATMISDRTAMEGELVEFTSAFTDAGSADTHSFLWHVVSDNGQVIPNAATADFSFTPTADGVYTVTLTVTDDDGGTATGQAKVAVGNVGPQNVMISGVLAVNEGQPVALTGTFTDAGAADAHVLNWHVVASNGQMIADGTSSTFGFVPADEGTYAVTLTVTDDDGLSASKMATVTAANVAPTIALLTGPTNLDEGQLAEFTAAAADPGVDMLSFEWDFGDGTGTAAGAAVQHTFADNGSFVVTLTVHDGDGGIVTETIDLTVNNVAPSLQTAADQETTEGAALALAQIGSFVDLGFGAGELFTFTIDWGDGTPADTGSSPIGTVGGPGVPTAGSFGGSHTYGDDGTYTVTIAVTDDDGGSVNSTLTVMVSNVAPAIAPVMNQTVNEGSPLALSPIATITDPGFAQPTVPSAETFTASIDWGDGTPAELGQVTIDTPGAPGTPTTASLSGSHTYLDNGDYTVKLTVTDDDDATTVATFMVAVANVAPAVTIAMVTEPGQAGGQLQLVGGFADPGADTWRLLVDYGDGMLVPAVLEGMGFELSRVYNEGGNFIVVVNVRDDDGGEGTAEASFTVAGPPGPPAPAGGRQSDREPDRLGRRRSDQQPRRSAPRLQRSRPGRHRRQARLQRGGQRSARLGDGRDRRRRQARSCVRRERIGQGDDHRRGPRYARTRRQQHVHGHRASDQRSAGSRLHHRQDSDSRQPAAIHCHRPRPRDSGRSTDVEPRPRRAGWRDDRQSHRRLHVDADRRSGVADSHDHDPSERRQHTGAA